METPNIDPDRLSAVIYENDLDSRITHGQILNRHESFLAAAYLLNDPDLTGFTVKAMDCEVDDNYPTDIFSRDGMIHLFLGSIQNAVKRGVKGEMILDRFMFQFRDGSINLTGKNMIEKLNGYRKNGDAVINLEEIIRIVDHRSSQFNLLRFIRSLPSLNHHAMADHLPIHPINIYREHDHRKLILLDFKNKPSILFLHTMNYDDPTDLDCSLVIEDEEIIEKMRFLIHSPENTNYSYETPDWSLYQDGSQSIDPHYPEATSPVLKRINAILQNQDIKHIEWSSKFLPDIDELKKIEWRLRNGTLNKTVIYSTHPNEWNMMYHLQGAYNNRTKVEQLALQYPNNFEIYYSGRHIHAKVIRYDNGLLIGSHNFNRTLVMSRTTDYVLDIRDMEKHTRNSLDKYMCELKNASTKYS